MVVMAESAQERGLSAGTSETAAAQGEVVEAVRRRKRAWPDAGTEFGSVRRQRRKPRSGKYGAQIWDPLQRNNVWLSTFGTAEDPAKAYGAAAQTNFKIPAVVRSSASVTAESAQEQGLSAYGCGIAEEHTNGVEAVERRKEKPLPDAETVFDGVRRPPSGTFGAAEDAAAVKLPCVKKARKKGGPYSRTGFWGVRQSPSGRYGAQIRDGKTDKWLGTFDTIEEAARAYDAAAIMLRGAAAKTNFRSREPSGPARLDGVEAVERRKDKALPDARTEFRGEWWRPSGKYLGTAEDAVAVKLPCVKKATCRPVGGTGFRGVHRQRSGKYGAAIMSENVRRWLGTFDAAEEAARAYDAAAIQLRGAVAKTNFKSPAAPVAADINPGQVQMIRLKQAPVAAPAKVNSNVEVRRRAVVRSDSRSGFRGVGLYGGRFIARIREPGRPTTRHHLGIFDNVEDAARAYDAAALRLYGAAARTNFEQPPTGAAADDDEAMDLLNEFRCLCAARASL
ncbi:unnamed protein product [Alopecurus aequalis]